MPDFRKGDSAGVPIPMGGASSVDTACITEILPIKIVTSLRLRRFGPCVFSSADLNSRVMLVSRIGLEIGSAEAKLC